MSLGFGGAVGRFGSWGALEVDFGVGIWKRRLICLKSISTEPEPQAGNYLLFLCTEN